MHSSLYFLFLLIGSLNAFAGQPAELPYSAPEQIVALTQESGKVGGIVNPLSGQPCLIQTDLVAKGAQDVILQRVFVSQHRDWYANLIQMFSKGLVTRPPVLESGWVVFPHIHLDYLHIIKRRHHRDITVKDEARIVTPNGVVLTFALESDGTTRLVDKPYGICNSYSPDEVPGGQYDLRNTKIVHKDRMITVYSPLGSIYQYASSNEEYFQDFDKKILTCWARYLLVKEVLPNGKILRYRYNKDRELCRVESMDPKGHHVYASIDIDSSPFQSVSKFTTHTTKSASYQQQRKRRPWVHDDNRALNLLAITSVSTPFYANETVSVNAKMLNSYSSRRNLFNCEYAESGEQLAKGMRVNKLLLPVDDAGFQHVHEISYQPPLIGEKAGSTTIKNIDGTSIVYDYSPQLLLTAVRHYDSQGLKMCKLLAWTEEQRLASISVQDQDNVLFYKKSYQYDAYGNPVLETYEGDLTGSGEAVSVTIKRKFSDDGRHLLLEEENEEGKTVVFQYLPDSNLVTAKLTKGRNQIVCREFYQYDDCNNLIQKIDDNGSEQDPNDYSGVTQRCITTYVLRQEQPFLHMPQWIQEKFWENGTERFLKSTYLAYDTHGNVVKEEVYDAEGKLVYTLHKTYNERGNLVAETNAMGQQAFYDYDDKGRRIASSNFSNTLQTRIEYDLRNNPIKIEETGVDKVVHSQSFTYDLNDNLIQKVDTFQNATKYSYEPLTSKVSRTESAPISGLAGESVPVTAASTYDAFGRLISSTDANGNMTTYRYGGHASPIAIIHPDGGIERMLYTKSGRLADYVDADGLRTSYEYDAQGRVISKNYSAADSEIGKENFLYDGSNLLEKTDLEGHKTCYHYDGAGRLSSEEFAEKVTGYTYDPLGRIAATIDHNGDNTLYTYYKYDLLDRVLEKRCTDAQGKLLTKLSYSYDADGNLASLTRNINGNESVETFAYDSFQRQIAVMDALEHQTTTTYNENFLNALSQNVLQTITTDPKKRSIVLNMLTTD